MNNTTIIFVEVIGVDFMLKFAILVATSSIDLGVTSADALGQDRPTNRAVGSEPTFGFFVTGAFTQGNGIVSKTLQLRGLCRRKEPFEME